MALVERIDGKLRLAVTGPLHELGHYLICLHSLSERDDLCEHSVKPVPFDTAQLYRGIFSENMRLSDWVKEQGHVWNGSNPARIVERRRTS